jgi:hypothetical protein
VCRDNQPTASTIQQHKEPPPQDLTWLVPGLLPDVEHILCCQCVLHPLQTGCIDRQAIVLGLLSHQGWDRQTHQHLNAPTQHWMCVSRQPMGLDSHADSIYSSPSHLRTVPPPKTTNTLSFVERRVASIMTCDFLFAEVLHGIGSVGTQSKPFNWYKTSSSFGLLYRAIEP